MNCTTGNMQDIPYLSCIQETVQEIVPCAAPENIQETRDFLDTGHISEV